MKAGRPPLSADKRKVLRGYRLPPNMARQIELVAQEQNITSSDVVRYLIGQGIDDVMKNNHPNRIIEI